MGGLLRSYFSAVKKTQKKKVLISVSSLPFLVLKFIELLCT